ncbi:MAG TPA: hypothetical protein VMF08_16695 [Candidatus Sulfotelmatobacter sp.]|nr:hypothetical protein [Candidatus Sulfotelmatobacter sp.]
MSNAVAQASPGDVVDIPAGTITWSQTLILSNGVSLNGAGTNSTILIDEENRSVSAQMIMVYPAAGYESQISNLQLQGGTTNTSPNYFGAIAVYGFAGSSWRIDNCVFNGLYAKSICTYGNSLSVIDHNFFFEKLLSIAANTYIPNDGEGDASWASPPTYGLNSSNVLYIENNFFTNLVGYVASVGACDGNGGSRMVFRYNTVWNDCFNNHGTESGGRIRSQRSFEVYGNTFICPTNSVAYPIFAAMLIRGGSGVIFSNSASGYNDLVALRNYRYTCTYYNEWDPFAGANGLSWYDSNDPTLYLTGTNSAPSGSTYLQVNGAHWTPNQWYGYTVLNTNNGGFSVITSNTTNIIYYLGSTVQSASIVACSVLTFNMGDTFQIRRVYAALDQPGRGSGNLLEDLGVATNGESQGFGLGTNQVLLTINTSTGIPSWPNQALDGIYAWGNTTNGVAANLDSMYPTLQAGRDYYNNTQMPGYTPFVYPHPLVTYVGVSTNPPPPPQTNGPLPPTNLHQIYPNP